MSHHTWSRNVVIPRREVTDPETGKVHVIEAFVWFPKCSTCGCLTNGSLYRATPSSDWSSSDPGCAR